MPTAPQALLIIRQALPGATPAEQHFVWAITRLETGWGTGWKDNSLGLASHNWGAVTAPAGQGFLYNDPLNGKDRIHTFRIYRTDAEGIQDAARYSLKPNVRQALASGNAIGAVQGMRDNGYYEAPVSQYLKAVQNNYLAALRDSPAEVSRLSFVPQKATDWLIVLASAGAVGWFFRKELGFGK